MSDRFHHLFINAADFDASVAFYRDILGWTATGDWAAPGGARAMMMSGGGVRIVVAERKANGNAAEALEAGPRMHLDIHDIEARFRQLPKGPHVVTQPEDTPWGTRWFVVRDPDGNLIAFEEVHRRGA
jgi:catechol 2,3-dioxygenase-like lactoylglutathione lyase family enzyme